MKVFTPLASILEFCRLVYRFILWKVLLRFRESIILDTAQGTFVLPLDTDDPISRTLFIRGHHELDLISNAMSFLRRIEKCPPKGQGTVLDIGANNGVISIGMLVADEINRAIAIEPDPRNFSLLQRNIELNHLEEKVVCLNYAVSDTKSELDFELSEDNYGDHRIRRGAPDSRARELFAESRRRVIEVQADRLDSLIDNLPSLSKEEISVIWIDVQGYEGFVFLGATDVLSQDIPVVAEIWPYGIQRAGMSQETFCEIAGEIWSSYWVMDGEGILEYSVEELDWLFKELGYDGDFTNVIFTR